MIEKKSDDNGLVEGMNHSTKKGAQVETSDEKDIAGVKGLKQRVKSSIISLL